MSDSPKNHSTYGTHFILKSHEHDFRSYRTTYIVHAIFEDEPHELRITNAHNRVKEEINREIEMGRHVHSRRRSWSSVSAKDLFGKAVEPWPLLLLAARVHLHVSSSLGLVQESYQEDLVQLTKTTWECAYIP